MSSPSGSGVVPDKPALAPTVACRDCGEPKQAGGKCCTYWETGWRPNASVPAVTDDEAATDVVRSVIAASLGACLPLRMSPQQITDAIVAALREAGFLIVHHTKET